MNSRLLLFSLLFSCLLFVQCEYFSTTTHTPQQIKKASQWSEEDQMPSFTSCLEEAEEDRFSCFKNTIASSVSNALEAEELISNQEIDREIVLVLEVSEEGKISIVSIDDASVVLDALPALSSILESAINELPEAIPALKTNVDLNVKSQLKLPIRVIASPQ